MYNILICNDEKGIVSALKIYFASSEYNLFEAYDGRETLDVIGKNEIHLVMVGFLIWGTKGNFAGEGHMAFASFRFVKKWFRIC